jgi:DNA topoisomerase VI subunit A
MLELCKEILTKVSFDQVLFQKELKKSLKWIKKEEVDGFKKWCLSTFGKQYPKILKLTFKK